MPDNDPLSISGQLVAEKYRIERLVGEGGFAVVYRAEHTIWKQPVAVKFFSGLSQAPAEYREELLHQFIQEGALLTELSSQTAGIVQARDIGDYTTPAGSGCPTWFLSGSTARLWTPFLRKTSARGWPGLSTKWSGFSGGSCPSSTWPTDEASPTGTSSRPTSSSWAALLARLKRPQAARFRRSEDGF